MKKILSTLVAALAALSFSAVVFAADVAPAPAADAAPAAVEKKEAKPVKKHKKVKKAKKAKKAPKKEEVKKLSQQQFIKDLNKEYAIKNVAVNEADVDAKPSIDKMVQDIKGELNIKDQKPADQINPNPRKEAGAKACDRLGKRLQCLPRPQVPSGMIALNVKPGARVSVLAV